MQPVLSVENLSVIYPDGFCLQPLSFTLNAGETLAVVGESGSGKTTLARAIMGTQDCGQSTRKGTAYLGELDLLSASDTQLRNVRMSKIAVVFQNSHLWLNPAQTLRAQLYDVLKKQYSQAQCAQKASALMAQVGLCEKDLVRYPSELSGGMVQRFLLAQAIALSPKLVVLDEPTSALDVDARRDFIALVQSLQVNSGIAFLLITHDLLLAQAIATRVMVLYHGFVEECGTVKEILQAPRHPYTVGLLRASAELAMTRDLWGIRAGANCDSGCPFAPRCTQALPTCHQSVPELQTMSDGRLLRCHRGGVCTLLQGEKLCKAYGASPVLQDVSLEVKVGEVVALVGASGSGKTTLANITSGFLTQDSGIVHWQGNSADFDTLHRTVGGLQLVMQDCTDALNQAFTIAQAVGEPLLLSGAKRETIHSAVTQALHDVELPTDNAFLSRTVRNVSGGQQQRIALARALTMRPALLVADEPTSMLDVSTKANVLRMLKGLQNKYGFSMLMVTHDLAIAEKIANRTYRLHQGTLLEKSWQIQEELSC